MATKLPSDWHTCPIRLRIPHLLTIYGVSRPTLYRHMYAGLIPQPSGHDSRPWWISTAIAAHVGGGK